MSWPCVSLKTVKPGDVFSPVLGGKRFTMCISVVPYVGEGGSDCRHVMYLEDMRLREIWLESSNPVTLWDV